MIAADVDLAGAAETWRWPAGQGLPPQLDVRSADSLAALTATVEQRFGGLDVLVNNAGIEILGRVDQTAPDVWDEIMAVNLRGTYLASRICCRCCCRRRRRARRRCDRQQRIADGAWSPARGWPPTALPRPEWCR